MRGQLAAGPRRGPGREQKEQKKRKEMGNRDMTYVESASILAREGHDGLAAGLELDLVLRPEPSHDLDAVGGRHDGGGGGNLLHEDLCYHGPFVDLDQAETLETS